MSVGDIYEAAANARDYGSSPQEALQRVQSWPVPSLDTKKFIINRVYFQDPFTFGRPEVLKMASIRYCYKPSQQFEPLK